MSDSHSAIAGIGIIIDLERIEFEEPERNCDHSSRIGNNFCPVCGAPVIDREDEYEADYESMAEIFEEAAKANGYIFSSLRELDAVGLPHYRYFLGWGWEKSSTKADYREEDVTVVGNLPSVGDVALALQDIIEDAEQNLRRMWEDDSISLDGFFSPSKIAFHFIMKI